MLPEKFVKQLFPCGCMHARCLGQDAVQIEQKCVVIPWRERDDGGCTSHGLFSGVKWNPESKYRNPKQSPKFEIKKMTAVFESWYFII
jgi:hypothetical protein